MSENDYKERLAVYCDALFFRRGTKSLSFRVGINEWTNDRKDGGD
jgi:hypothetical protein